VIIYAMGMAKRRRGNNVGWKYDAEGRIGGQSVERVFRKEESSRTEDGHL
jgi:YD repeat-containing protein